MTGDAGEQGAERSFEHGPAVWPDHVPDDARRMGLNRSVPDGALLDFAGSLDPAKPLHRITAWAMLVVFGFPVVMYVLELLVQVLHHWPHAR
ncbi:MAG: hypothetical protein ACXVWZ_05115 [Nocardioides sp.]